VSLPYVPAGGVCTITWAVLGDHPRLRTGSLVLGTHGEGGAHGMCCCFGWFGRWVMLQVLAFGHAASEALWSTSWMRTVALAALVSELAVFLPG